MRPLCPSTPPVGPVLLLWLLEEVRARRLGFGKAAELAGMPQARFLDLMGEHSITPFDYDAAELATELSLPSCPPRSSLRIGED